MRNKKILNNNILSLLRYYPKDYRPVNPTVPSLEATINSGTGWLYKPYYTGWISSWSLNLDTLHTSYSFTYDQLGQLRHARTLTGFSGTHWNATIAKAFSTSYTYDPVGNIRTLKRFDKDGNLLDDLTYHYYDTLHNNKLSHITDAVNTSNFLHDLEIQNPGNYSYDSVGNMISDASRTLTVQYTYSNRPKFINFANGRSLKMKYNPFGYRFFSGPGNSTGDVFIYSSQGQLVAKYKVFGNTLKLNYLSIYEGSRRIGIVEPESVEWEYCPDLLTCLEDVPIDEVARFVGGYVQRSLLKSERKYELTDHLGNVRVVIANQRLPVDTNGDSLVDYYKPLVKEISDYYPYGWVKFYGDYEFGANAGSLFEDWDSTRGTYYTLYRLLDARIARWYQVEPKIESYGTWSGYSYVFNNPVMSVDLLGLDTAFADDNARQMFNEVYNAVSNRLSALDKQVSDLEIKLQNKKLKRKERKAYEEELSKLREAYSAVSEIKKMLDDIIASDIIVEYSTRKYDGDSCPPQRGGTQVDPDDNNKVKVWVYEGFISAMLHESRHALGYMLGEWGAEGILALPVAYDFMDEKLGFEIERLYFRYLSSVIPTDSREREF